jgi:hypothetical protein
MNKYAPASILGVAVAICDLGDWGESELRSEYDPKGPIIRINSRVLNRVQGSDRARFVARAIGHEIYHHHERTGIIPRIVRHADREIMADRFAAEHLHEFEDLARVLLFEMAIG